MPKVPRRTSPCRHDQKYGHGASRNRRESVEDLGWPTEDHLDSERSYEGSVTATRSLGDHAAERHQNRGPRWDQQPSTRQNDGDDTKREPRASSRATAKPSEPGGEDRGLDWIDQRGAGWVTSSRCCPDRGCNGQRTDNPVGHRLARSTTRLPPKLQTLMNRGRTQIDPDRAPVDRRPVAAPPTPPRADTLQNPSGPHILGWSATA